MPCLHHDPDAEPPQAHTSFTPTNTIDREPGSQGSCLQTNQTHCVGSENKAAPKMSQLSTPRKPIPTTSTLYTTPKTQHTPRLKFRTDGSLEPDPNPIKLTSPLRTPNHNHNPNRHSRIFTETELDITLTAILRRFFSTLNSETVFLRTLGKLDPDIELEILGDTDGWAFLEEGKHLSREKKLVLINLYGTFDRKMRFVLKQAGTMGH